MAKKKIDGDEGQTVADMNVEGMPWYQKETEEAKAARGRAESGERLTGRQLFHAITGATAAALLVALVLCAALVLFILFCTNVWLK